MGFPRSWLVAVGVRVDVIVTRTDGGMLRSGGCLDSRRGEVEEEEGGGGVSGVSVNAGF